MSKARGESQQITLEDVMRGDIDPARVSELRFEDADYEKAKNTLKKKTPYETICYEDVLMQILREGGEVVLIDHEYDGEYTSRIKLEDVHERVSLTPIRHLTDAINERDDAETADCIIQSVFYKEVIFG